jgi:hypothetical protein
MANDNLHGFLRNSIPGFIFLLSGGTFLLLMPDSLLPNKLLQVDGVLKGIATTVGAYPIGLVIQWLYRAWYLQWGEEAWIQCIQAKTFLGPNDRQLRCRKYCHDAAYLAWAFAHGSLKGSEIIAHTLNEYRESVKFNFSMMHMLGASIVAIWISILSAFFFLFLRPPDFDISARIISWSLAWAGIAAAASAYRDDQLETILVQLKAFLGSHRHKIRELAIPLLLSWHG